MVPTGTGYFAKTVTGTGQTGTGYFVEITTGTGYLDHRYRLFRENRYRLGVEFNTAGNEDFILCDDQIEAKTPLYVLSNLRTTIIAEFSA